MRKLYYGAAIYPELWSKEIIQDDIEHMEKLGFNLARLGEFAWGTMEPEQDQFDFSILTQTLELLAEHNIDAVVCTPTPTPPIWLTDGYPERLHQNERGEKMHHGSRQHVCINDPYFRERAAIITEKLMEAIKPYDHIIAIQLDNEFKCHVDSCYCENCKQLWSEWLQNKYKDINILNDAWGTDIWSQRYLSFSQVVQPLSTPFLHNSSLLQNYKEFNHDSLAEFAQEQADIVRVQTDIQVTHNTGMFFDLDNEKLAETLDFVSFDTYTPVEKYPNFMMNQERWRYLKSDTDRVMLLETTTSHNGHLDQYGKLYDAGYLPLESFVTYASGIEAFTYWLFRGQKSGCEQPHGSVVSAWGDPTIGYKNVVAVADLIEQITPHILATETVVPRVGVTYSDRARSFIDVEPGEDYVYKDLLNDFYKYLLDVNVERKVVPENYDLAKCEVLFTPYLHYISDQFLARLLTFIENGGIWIAGPMTGGRTKEHTWHTDGGLGQLTSIAGIKSMIEFPTTGAGHYGNALGIESELTGLSHLFEVEDDVNVIGEVVKGQASGKAFLIEKEIGKGKLVLLGSKPDDAMMKTIIEHYTVSYKIDPLISDLADEIVIIPRQTKDQIKQHWMVNFSNEASTFTLNQPYKDLLEDRIINSGKFTLPPYGYCILSQI